MPDLVNDAEALNILAQAMHEEFGLPSNIAREQAADFAERAQRFWDASSLHQRGDLILAYLGEKIREAGDLTTFEEGGIADKLGAANRASLVAEAHAEIDRAAVAVCGMNVEQIRNWKEK